MANQKQSDLSDKALKEKEPTFEELLEESTQNLREHFGDRFDDLDIYIESKLKKLHDRLKGK